MDPLCVSLIQQYLDSTNSSLAVEFKNKYEPEKTNVPLTEALSTWREQELTRSLVFQHLKSVAPSLADEFNVKYQPRKTKVQLNEVLSKWKEEQIARSFVYKHLKEVAPYIAAEFHLHDVGLTGITNIFFHAFGRSPIVDNSRNFHP